LKWDPKERITPEAAIFHPFIMSEYSKNILSGKARVSEEIRGSKKHRIQTMRLTRNSSDAFINTPNSKVPKGSDILKTKLATFRAETGKVNPFLRIGTGTGMDKVRIGTGTGMHKVKK